MTFTPSDNKFYEAGGYVDLSYPLSMKQFIETYCCQTSYPHQGDPLKLMGWQWNMIARAWGEKNKDGTDRFKEIICFLPKKNGKSSLLSCLLLLTLMGCAGSYSICLATDYNEAKTVFNEAATMAELSPELSKVIKVTRGQFTIENVKNKAVCKMMSGVPHGKAGHKVSGLQIWDELAAWKNVYARDVARQLENASAPFPNAKKIIISTAQFERDGNLGYEYYRKAKDILAGNILDTTVLPIIYEVDDTEDWKEESSWIKANPSVGITFPIQDLRDDYQKVINNPVEETRFRTLRLNQWTGLNEFVSGHIIGQRSEKLDYQSFKGCPAIMGLDMSKRYDLSSFTILAKRDGHYYAFTRAFSPKDIAYKKALTDGVPYDIWSKQGFLHLTEGDVIDHEVIRGHIANECKHFKVNSICFDSYGMEETRRILEADLEIPLYDVPQTYPVISSPTATLERLLRTGGITLDKNPLLSWCFNNIKLVSDSNNRIKIDKRRSRGRVDCVTSLIIALYGWQETPDEVDLALPVFFG